MRGSDNFDSAAGAGLKAWVNFNGSGTVAIRKAFNVSSITDHATGDYTINFSTAMADSSYVVSGCLQDTGGYFSTVVSLRHSSTASPTASGFRMIAFGWSAGAAGVPFDSPIVNLAIFS
tara:strand:- start:630 stop:986 length:357 start_codon:yes stop_codon:yes gene_type:complete